ncbi:MAG TPA: diguanylate cyclase [Verrucomicrobiae bacterium]|nr:diguanylate cyclase [Verrucomicrobiae bacterium]
MMDSAETVRRLRVTGLAAVTIVAVVTILEVAILGWRNYTAPARIELLQRENAAAGAPMAVLYWAGRAERDPAQVPRLRAAIADLEASQRGSAMLGANGLASLDRFTALASSLARSPHDARLQRLLEASGLQAHRELTAASQRALVDSVQQRSRFYEGVILASAFVLFVVGGLYLLVVRPGEAAIVVGVRELEERRQRFAAMFENSSETMAIYDVEGRIVRANGAARTLFGFGPESIGSSFLVHVSPRDRDVASEAFAAARRGRAVPFAADFVDSSGREVPVLASVSPIVVGGEVVGVVGAARDVSEVRRFEQALMRSRELLSGLYAIASTPAAGASQIDAALEMGAKVLKMECGVVVEVENGMLTVLHRYGVPDLLPVGERQPITRTIGEKLAASSRAVAIGDLSVEPYASELAGRGLPWRCYIGSRLHVGEKSSGILVFLDRNVRAVPFDRSDVDFVDLMSALIASAVARERLEERLREMAFQDALTGLPNRALLEDYLSRTLAAARRSEERVALHYIDLDRFKPVNDDFGHAAGDEVLREVARRFSAVVRGGEMIARIGGDEFAVVQAGKLDNEQIERLAARLRGALDDPIALSSGVRVSLGASVGTAIFPVDEREAQPLLRAADAAMYREKERRRTLAR